MEKGTKRSRSRGAYSIHLLERKTVARSDYYRIEPRGSIGDYVWLRIYAQSSVAVTLNEAWSKGVAVMVEAGYPYNVLDNEPTITALSARIVWNP